MKYIVAGLWTGASMREHAGLAEAEDDATARAKQNPGSPIGVFGLIQKYLSPAGPVEVTHITP